MNRTPPQVWMRPIPEPPPAPNASLGELPEAPMPANSAPPVDNKAE